MKVVANINVEVVEVMGKYGIETGYLEDVTQLFTS